MEDKGDDIKDLETTGRAETDNTGAEEYHALTHDATNHTLSTPNQTNFITRRYGPRKTKRRY